MKHISDSLIERLRNDISLVRLIEAKGVQLSKKGDDFAGRCPFHVDTELSLIVNPRLNQWSCEGTCNTTGSVLDWVMRAEGVSLHHAVDLLQSDDPVLMKPITGIKQNTVLNRPGF